MKTLKALTLSSLLVGSIQSASGMLLLGFNSFDEDVPGLSETDSYPDEAATGWSGSINHNSNGFSATGGSTDGFYGKDWDQPGQGLMIYSPVTSGNGYIDGANNVMLSGGTTVGGPVTALLFDASSITSASVFKINWNFWTDNTKTASVASGSSPNLTVGPGVGPNITTNYQDFAIDLGSFFLPANGYFEIVWNRVSGVTNYKLDNIALVPEPGSMLGLGCLVGFGTLLRSRRRTGPAVIA